MKNRSDLAQAQAVAATDTRSALWLGFLLLGVFLILAACGRNEDRIAFDGQFYNAKLKQIDRQFNLFSVSVTPVSASLDGAREAGRYEASSYCVTNFGTSDIAWTSGPDAEEVTLDGDTLLLQGSCEE